MFFIFELIFLREIFENLCWLKYCDIEDLCKIFFFKMIGIYGYYSILFFLLIEKGKSLKLLLLCCCF